MSFSTRLRDRIDFTIGLETTDCSFKSANEKAMVRRALEEDPESWHVWSKQARVLDGLAKKKKNNKHAKRYGRFEVMQEMLTDLNLRNCNITELDAGLANLSNLQELNISENRLQEICNLPAKLNILHAYNNQITRMTPVLSQNSLVHLGLGWNKITNLHWLKDLQSLRSLDLSFNDLCDLRHATDALSETNVQVLHMQGNPLALLSGYQSACKQALPLLQTLDDTPVQQIIIAAPSISSTIKLQVDVSKLQQEQEQQNDEEQEQTATTITLHVNGSDHDVTVDEPLLLDLPCTASTRDELERGLFITIGDDCHTINTWELFRNSAIATSNDTFQIHCKVLL